MFYYNIIYSDNTRYCFYTLYYASFKKPCFISHGYIIHCFVILSSIKKIIFSKKEKTLRIIIILKVFVTCFRRVFR